MIPVLLFVIVFNFLIINLAPGDPVVVLAGENATQEYMDELRESFGLNEPLHTRFLIYFSNLIQGDLGISYTYNAPVTEVLLEKLQVTLMLVVLSETVTIFVGTLLG